MTQPLIALLLSSVLAAAALGGPRLLRRAAPALATIPRFAAIALSLTAVLWIAALVALGPVVAWMSSGPDWLPQQVADVCDRCLSAASPFGESAVTIGVPAIVPLALPSLGVVAVLIGLAREFAALRRSQSQLSLTVRSASERVRLHGNTARITQDTALLAFSLPHRHGGIVLSRGTVASLSEAELAAVLAHEQAHLDERHHLIVAILNGATQYLRWIPLIREVRSAVPHYLEIAADRAAKQAAGTDALAGALLKLGQPGIPESAGKLPAHAVLHAAGSERIRHLVGAPRPPASTALAAAAGMYAFMLAAVIAAVHLPFVLALLAGCL